MQVTKQIAVVGHLSIDTIKVNEQVYNNMLGGAALYSACALSTNDAHVHLISTFCEDFDFDRFLSTKPCNVNIDQLIPILGNQRRAFMEYSKHFERTSHNHAREEWLKDTLRQSPRQIPCKEIEYDAVMLVPMLPEIQLQYISWFRRNTNAIIFLDTSEYFAEHNRYELKELIKLVDIFIPSNVELDYIFPENDGDIELHINSLRSCGLERFVIKRSTKGSLIVDGHDSIIQCGIRNTKAVDATGAGDSFAGALLSRFLVKNDLVEAAKFAAVISSFCVEKVGFAGLLDLNYNEIDYAISKIDTSKRGE